MRVTSRPSGKYTHSVQAKVGNNKTSLIKSINLCNDIPIFTPMNYVIAVFISWDKQKDHTDRLN